MPDPNAEIRERLLDAGLAHFARHGVEASSMRAIARDAGTSVGMITYYFGSRDGLFFALLDRFYTPLRAELESLAAHHEDPLERLRALLRRLAELSPPEALAGRALVRELTIESDRVDRVRALFMRGHVRLVFEALHGAIAAGQLREVPLMATLPAIIAPFVLPRLVNLPAMLGVEPGEQVDATFDILLHGLLPRATSD